MTRHRYLATTAAIIAAAALAACSSNSSGSAAPPVPIPTGSLTSSATAAAPAGSTAAAAPDSSTSAAAAASQVVDVCKVLPPATIAQLTGVRVSKAHARQPISQSGTTIAACNYTGGMNQLDITFTRSILADQLFQDDYSANKQVLDKTAMVSGIGDKAFTANFPSMWLEVLWGDEQLEIDGASTVSVDAAKRVLTALHDKA